MKSTLACKSASLQCKSGWVIITLCSTRAGRGFIRFEYVGDEEKRGLAFITEAWGIFHKLFAHHYSVISYRCYVRSFYTEVGTTFPLHGKNFTCHHEKELKALFIKKHLKLNCLTLISLTLIRKTFWKLHENVFFYKLVLVKSNKNHIHFFS